jgi:hypothetical protein
MTAKADNWPYGAVRRLLVDITLSDPSARRDSVYATNPGSSVTLRLCDGPTPTGPFSFGGNQYTPCLDRIQGQSSRVDFLGGVSDAFATLRVANVRLPFQKPHAAGGIESAQQYVKISQLLSDYVWSGAAIVCSIYSRLGASETSLPVFTGIIHSVESLVDVLVVRVVQDKKAIRLKPDSEGPGSSSFPSVITRVSYPTAPESSIGRTLPLPYSNPFQVPATEDLYGLCVNPANMTGAYPIQATAERYDGTYNGTFVLGSYPTQVAPAVSAVKLMLWNPSIATFSVFTGSGVTLTRGTTETYVQISPNATVDLYLNPTEFVAGTTGVTDPGKAFDGRSDSYAQLAYSGAARQLDLRIPYVSSLGRIMGCYAWVLFAPGGTGAGATDVTVNGTFGLWNPDAAPAGYHNAVSGFFSKANVRDGGYVEVDLTATTYNTSEWQSWKWEGRSAVGARQDIYLRIAAELSGCTARIAACGLKVRYAPKQIFFSSNKPSVYDVQGRRVG